MSTITALTYMEQPVNELDLIKRTTIELKAPWLLRPFIIMKAIWSVKEADWIQIK